MNQLLLVKASGLQNKLLLCFMFSLMMLAGAVMLSDLKKDPGLLRSLRRDHLHLK